MKWIRKLFGLKEKVPKETEVSEQPSKTTEEIEFRQIKEEKETAHIKLPKILTDKDGNDLLCALCNNEDNETGKYHPIREGDKRSFGGAVYHTKCLRVLKKSGAKGDLF